MKYIGPIFLAIAFIGGVYLGYHSQPETLCPPEEAYVYGHFVPDGMFMPVPGWTRVLPGTFSDTENYLTTAEMDDLIEDLDRMAPEPCEPCGEPEIPGDDIDI